LKLTKTSQKIDNNVCKALTVACEEFLHDISGFKWLTHRANYTNFPASLVITCVFECEADVETMKTAKQDEILRNAIQKQLLKVGVVAKNIKQQVHFDTEESCEAQHQGDWTSRLALNVVKQKFNMKKAH
jgi:hypothetical protein